MIEVLRTKLRNGLARMQAFGRLGVTLTSRLHWISVGACHSWLWSWPWHEVLRGWHAFRPWPRSERVLRVQFRDFDDLIIFEEVFMFDHYPLGSLGFEPDLVVDCGAHVGFFTLLASARFPEAERVSVEPNPENFECLRVHSERNRLGGELVEAAVALVAGEATFAGRGFRGSLVDHDVEGSIRVRTIALNDLITEKRPQRLLVKMDVEGAEHTLIPKLVPIMPPDAALFVEWHGSKATWRGAQALLAEAGFRIRVLLDETGDDGGVAIAAAVRRAEGSIDK